MRGIPSSPCISRSLFSSSIPREKYSSSEFLKVLILSSSTDAVTCGGEDPRVAFLFKTYVVVGNEIPLLMCRTPSVKLFPATSCFRKGTLLLFSSLSISWQLKIFPSLKMLTKLSLGKRRQYISSILLSAFDKNVLSSIDFRTLTNVGESSFRLEGAETSMTGRIFSKLSCSLFQSYSAHVQDIEKYKYRSKPDIKTYRKPLLFCRVLKKGLYFWMTSTGDLMPGLPIFRSVAFYIEMWYRRLLIVFHYQSSVWSWRPNET